VNGLASLFGGEKTTDKIVDAVCFTYEEKFVASQKHKGV